MTTNKLSLEEVDEYLRKNVNRFGAETTLRMAKQLAETMRENERLKADLDDEIIHRRVCADKVRTTLKYLDAGIPNKDSSHD